MATELIGMETTYMKTTRKLDFKITNDEGRASVVKQNKPIFLPFDHILICSPIEVVKRDFK